MKLIGLRLGLVAALLPTSVAAGQERPAPSVELPEVELEAPDFLQPSVGGLTSVEAAERAVRTAPQVRRARAAQRSAGARVDEAISSFVPRFDFSASYNRINEVTFPPFEIPGLPPVDNPFPQVLDLWAVQGTLEIPVSDYFLVLLPAYDGAQGFLDAQVYEREVQEQAIAFRARQAYYQYARSLATVWVAEEAVTSLEASARDIEALVQAGVSARAELAQVRANLARAEVAVVQAEGGLRVSDRQLRQLLHADDDERFFLGEDLFAAPRESGVTHQDLLTEAMEARPEVLALRALLTARQAVVRSRVGSTLPRIALNGSVETSNPNPRVIPQVAEFFTTWVLGASVAWSPNDLAVGYHQVRQAELDVEQVEEDIREIRDLISVEAENAVATFEAASESIGGLQDGLVAAQVALDDRRALLAAGAGTSTEFVQAQLDQVNARLDLIDAYVNVRIAEAGIDRVRGRAYPVEGRP